MKIQHVYKVFEKKDGDLYVSDWAESGLHLIHVSKQGMQYCEFSYKEGGRLIKALEEAVIDKDYWMKEKKNHNISIETIDKKIEIGFHAEHNLCFIWLTPAEAKKLAQQIGEVIKDHEDPCRHS